MTVDEQRIRALAYQIWESEGCPEGQEQRHWRMATTLAAAAETPTPSVPVKRTRKVRPQEELMSEALASRRDAGAEKGTPKKAAPPKAGKKPGKETASRSLE